MVSVPALQTVEGPVTMKRSLFFFLTVAETYARTLQSAEADVSKFGKRHPGTLLYPLLLRIYVVF